MADYKVGYKNPPIETRFKKGTSGNPSGKAKPATDVLTALEKTLSAPVTITRGGQSLTVSRLEAALERLVGKAAQGDTSAFRILSALLQTYQPPTEAPSSSKEELEQADQKILSRILADFARN
jgi:uncharacterized protein DUF5681